jgi:predicted nucleic acid-binding protein
MAAAIVIPRAVHDELVRASAPEAVRSWMVQKPDWLQVREPASPPDPVLVALHAGERDTILIASEIRADQLIIDD